MKYRGKEVDCVLNGIDRRDGLLFFKDQKVVLKIKDNNYPEDLPPNLPIAGYFSRRWGKNYGLFWDQESNWFLNRRQFILLDKAIKVHYKWNLLWYDFRLEKEGKIIFRKYGIFVDFLYLLGALDAEWWERNAFNWIYERFQSKEGFISGKRRLVGGGREE